MLGGQDFDPFGVDDTPVGMLEQMERNRITHARPETSRQQIRQPMGPQVINQSPSPIKISNESPSMYMTPDSDNFDEGETLEGLEGLKAMTPRTSKILEDLLPGDSAAGVGVGAAGTRSGTKRPPAQIGIAKTNKRGKQPAKKGKAGPSRQGPNNGGGGGGGGGDDGGWDDDNDDARSGVPSDQGDLTDAFEQMSKKERERLRKKNVQSVTHTSTITTVYKDGRPPSVSRTSTRESPAPSENSV